MAISTTLTLSSLGGRGRDYLWDHWRGRQSLAWSFWVNLVLPRVLILNVESFIFSTVEGDIIARSIIAILYFAFAHIIVFTWQIVGLVRACDRYQASHGSVFVVYAAYVGIFLSLVFTLVNNLASAQYVLEPKPSEPEFRLDRDHFNPYRLSVSDDGGTLYLTGSFELGVTKGLATYVGERPAAKRIVLSSHGGNVFEGRGVAKVIRNRNLDTHVSAECFSACTIAFIAGARRTLGPGGVLGFHQYRIDADYQVPFVDIAEVQAGDLEIFKARNVSDAFLEKVFATSNTGLWIPDTAELIEGGVVHEVISGPFSD